MFLFIFFVWGLIVGSFLNVCIYRLPEGKSIVFPPSHCPQCKHRLKWKDNIPLLSFILLKGHCRYCGHPISWQYPLVELITAIFSVLAYCKWKLSLTLIYYLVFIYALIAVSFIDIKHQIIPDCISLPGIVLGISGNLFLNYLSKNHLPSTLNQGLSIISFKSSLLGAALGGGILFLVAYGYYFVTKREGMGGGDIKLMAMIGAFLGIRVVPAVIFLASLAGSIVGIFWILAKGKDRYFPIPFGPFLALGALLCLFFPVNQLIPTINP